MLNIMLGHLHRTIVLIDDNVSIVHSMIGILRIKIARIPSAHRVPKTGNRFGRNRIPWINRISRFEFALSHFDAGHPFILLRIPPYALHLLDRRGSDKMVLDRDLIRPPPQIVDVVVAEACIAVDGLRVVEGFRPPLLVPSRATLALVTGERATRGLRPLPLLITRLMGVVLLRGWRRREVDKLLLQPYELRIVNQGERHDRSTVTYPASSMACHALL